MDTTCQVYSQWVTHPRGNFKACIYPILQTVSFILYKKGATWQSTLGLIFLPFTLTSSAPSNMHKWNNKNKNMPLLDVASAILGVIFESFSYFRPLERVTKSHRFQWFPSSFILQVLQVRFLTLVTYTHPMPLVYKCQINSSVNPVLLKRSVLIETSHLGIQILLNLTLLFLTNLISH